MNVVDIDNYAYNETVYKLIESTAPIWQTYPVLTVIMEKLDDGRVLMFHPRAPFTLSGILKLFGDFNGDVVMYDDRVAAIVCKPKEWALVLKRTHGTKAVQEFISHLPSTGSGEKYVPDQWEVLDLFTE